MSALASYPKCRDTFPDKLSEAGPEWGAPGQGGEGGEGVGFKPGLIHNLIPM